MSDTPKPPPGPQERPLEVRWQAFFQRACEALFLLSRRRRILFVNAAWEKLTGLSAAQARGLTCAGRAVTSRAKQPEGHCGVDRVRGVFGSLWRPRGA